MRKQHRARCWRELVDDRYFAASHGVRGWRVTGSVGTTLGKIFKYSACCLHFEANCKSRFHIGFTDVFGDLFYWGALLWRRHRGGYPMQHNPHRSCKYDAHSDSSVTCYTHNLDCRCHWPLRVVGDCQALEKKLKKFRPLTPPHNPANGVPREIPIPRGFSHSKTTPRAGPISASPARPQRTAPAIRRCPNSSRSHHCPR